MLSLSSARSSAASETTNPARGSSEGGLVDGVTPRARMLTDFTYTLLAEVDYLFVSMIQH